MRARGSQREPEWESQRAIESHREPERDRERASKSQREPEGNRDRARVRAIFSIPEHCFVSKQLDKTLFCRDA